jgi:hypothetical protein
MKSSTRQGKTRQEKACGGAKKKHAEEPTKEHVELSDRLEQNGGARTGNIACGAFTTQRYAHISLALSSVCPFVHTH